MSTLESLATQTATEIRKDGIDVTTMSDEMFEHVAEAYLHVAMSTINKISYKYLTNPQAKAAFDAHIAATLV